MFISCDSCQRKIYQEEMRGWSQGKKNLSADDAEESTEEIQYKILMVKYADANIMTEIILDHGAEETGSPAESDRQIRRRGVRQREFCSESVSWSVRWTILHLDRLKTSLN